MLCKHDGKMACHIKETKCVENTTHLLTKDIEKCIKIEPGDDLHIVNVDESNIGRRTPKNDTMQS